jgi:hypothetical protein
VSIEGQTKETFGVRGSGLTKLEGIVAPGRGDLRKRARHPRRLVPLAPERNGGQIRRIGLHEQAIPRHQTHQFIIAPLVERHDPAERHVPSRFERGSGQRVGAGVAVHDTEDAGGSGFANDRAGVVFRVPGVNDYRPTHLRGERDLSRERGALGVAGGIVVVVVEPAFSDRDCLGQKLAQPGQVARCVKRRCVVGMNSRRREYEAGIVGCNLGGYDSRCERLPDADDRPRARIAGARDYLVAVAAEGRVREVGVAVDED